MTVVLQPLTALPLNVLLAYTGARTCPSQQSGAIAGDSVLQQVAAPKPAALAYTWRVSADVSPVHRIRLCAEHQRHVEHFPGSDFILLAFELAVAPFARLRE